MWLIDVETRQLAGFVGLEVPSYTILTHIWVSGQEVTFQEMRSAKALDYQRTDRRRSTAPAGRQLKMG